jgi:hypothetical protein
VIHRADGHAEVIDHDFKPEAERVGKFHPLAARS